MAMADSDPLQSWPSKMRSSRTSNAMTTGDMSNASFLQNFKSQYSQFNDLRGSFASQIPGSMSSQLDVKAGSSGKPTYVLNLHFLGLSDLPKAGWFERSPAYELIVHAGGVAKRIRPRIPAPPPGVAAEAIELADFVPADQLKVLERLDDRASIRCANPGEYFRVDVWEERSPLVDFGNTGLKRVMLGQCYVPLEHRYNRCPCTWPIVNRTDKARIEPASCCGHDDAQGKVEVGFLSCKFGLATMPASVRNLRVVEGSVGSSEIELAWDPPETDGGTALRGYRVEARLPGTRAPNDASSFLGGIADDTPRTASAPAVAEPTSVLRNLNGNTEYVFCVWAVSEAGPGAGSEVFGKTGAVPPGICGPPCLAEGEDGHYVQWLPPDDDGGADVVAYRVWLRALFANNLGEMWPGEGWIDLGLFEHRDDQTVPQSAPLTFEVFPECSGCLCSVSALNAAGLVGPSTQEVAVAGPQSPPPVPLYLHMPPPLDTSGDTQYHAPDALSHYQQPGALAAQQLQGDVGSQSLVASTAEAGPLQRPQEGRERNPASKARRAHSAGAQMSTRPPSSFVTSEEADWSVRHLGQAVGRVVDPAEIRSIAQQPRSGSADSRVAPTHAPRAAPREKQMQAAAVTVFAPSLPVSRPPSGSVQGSFSRLEGSFGRLDRPLGSWVPDARGSHQAAAVTAVAHSPPASWQPSGSAAASFARVEGSFGRLDRPARISLTAVEVPALAPSPPAFQQPRAGGSVQGSFARVEGSFGRLDEPPGSLRHARASGSVQGSFARVEGSFGRLDEPAGSWGLGQKGSLQAGRQSFDHR